MNITHAMLQCTCQSCWCVWKLRVTQSEGLGRRKGEEDALIILKLTDTGADGMSMGDTYSCTYQS